MATVLECLSRFFLVFFCSFDSHFELPVEFLEKRQKRESTKTLRTAVISTVSTILMDSYQNNLYSNEQSCHLTQVDHLNSSGH